MEVTPDTFYKSAEALNATGKPRVIAADDWSVLPDRDQQGCKHRFAASASWANQSSLVKVAPEQAPPPRMN